MPPQEAPPTAPPSADGTGDTSRQSAHTQILQWSLASDQATTLDYANQQNDDRDDEEDVDQSAHRGGGHHAEQPQDEQHDRNGCQHGTTVDARSEERRVGKVNA